MKEGRQGRKTEIEGGRKEGQEKEGWVYSLLHISELRFDVCEFFLYPSLGSNFTLQLLL